MGQSIVDCQNDGRPVDRRLNWTGLVLLLPWRRSAPNCTQLQHRKNHEEVLRGWSLTSAQPNNSKGGRRVQCPVERSICMLVPRITYRNALPLGFIGYLHAGAFVIADLPSGSWLCVLRSLLWRRTCSCFATGVMMMAHHCGSSLVTCKSSAVGYLRARPGVKVPGQLAW